MQRDEAKAILELCRPGRMEDHQDPLIAEAIGLLETDAELKAWFDQQQALDARISETYNQIEPPTDLKATILAGMRAHRLRSESERESDGVPNAQQAAILSGAHDKMDPPTTSQVWWRNPWIGIAAVFAVLFALAMVSRNEPPTQYASNAQVTLQAGIPPMIQFLASEIDTIKSQKRSFAKQCTEPKNLQSYLASVGAPSPQKIPASIESAPSLGCFTLDYNGVKLGMICFKESDVIHLITARKIDCTRHISEEPAFYEIGGQAFKVWIEGDQVYILSVEGSKEKLPKFI
ncbi:MAG: hypothetical protein ACPGSB_08650 [Opitutales bacterium]